MQLPLLKRGDLFDMGVLGCGPVMEVTMSREPVLGNQLVMDGNPIECNAGYHAVMLLLGEPFPIEVEAWFHWSGGEVCHPKIRWKRRGAYEPWGLMKRIYG